ncbi:MAG: hypothetical protein LBS27_09425 [Bifidobacteriaceae bacterium]|jgi:hypothetical protein|nr:hypothetical protein [Bifidobacteriaceae bacterium]
MAGALVAVFTVPRGASDATTPAGEIGTPGNPTNALTVNVQEIAQSDNGSSIVFNLTEYGDLDWFHLTGIPCSSPYFNTSLSPQPFDYCATAGGDGYVGREGGYRSVAKNGATALSWAVLNDSSPSPPGTAYRAVYEGSVSPVTYAWDSPAGSWDDEYDVSAATDYWNDSDAGNDYTHAPQYSGNHLEGAFYDPNQSQAAGSSTYDQNGYVIEVAYDASQDRVLRFVAGALQASAQVDITATDSSGNPLDTAVPFYPVTLAAGSDKANALYTVFIPAGHGAKITATLTAATNEQGHLTLGAAALSAANLAFESGLERPVNVDILEAPAVFNLSDPGETGFVARGDPRFLVDGWFHAYLREQGSSLRYTYNYYDGGPGASLTHPALWWPANAACSSYRTGVHSAPPNHENPGLVAADTAPDAEVTREEYPPYQGLWPGAFGYAGLQNNSYYDPDGDPPTTPPDPSFGGAVGTEWCTDQGMAKVAISSPVDVDRYLYVLIGALGGDPYAEATFGGSQAETTPIPATTDLNADPTMKLFRVLVPAGATGEVVFKMADAITDAKLIVGGLSIQRMPDWGSCQLPRDFPGWDQFLTWEGSDDVALAPYFQQFQFRALLNSIDPLPPSSVFDQGRLTAAYCEAIAWPTGPPPVGAPFDPEGDPLPDTPDQHPDQNGYGEDNEHDQDGDGDPDGSFVQEDDEDQTGDGDENGNWSPTDAGTLHQPMISLTKRAFTCQDDTEVTTPNTLLDTASPPPCQLEAAEGAMAAGTTVYWLFTVENIGLFGKFTPGLDPTDPNYDEDTNGWVTDQVGSGTAEPVCALTWKRTALSPETYAPGALAVDPIWPGEARSCFYSGVIG